ncbi:MAG: hypothetical protein LLG04_07650 [Parachlamydia sp.]|nr:hypothetical protein [Parachlamydia sp.]
MPFKPVPLRVFLDLVKLVDWDLKKGKIDWNLYDEENALVCSIKISHGKNSKANEVVAHSIKKVEREFKKRRLAWPPKRK